MDSSDAKRGSFFARIAVLTLLLSLLAVVLAGFRTYRQYHPGGDYSAEHGGMSDFHNGAYYPAMAFAEGLSPYGKKFCEAYPVPRSTPAYSPAIIALHVPITWLSLPAADVVYFIISVFVLGLAVWVVVREWDKRYSLDMSIPFQRLAMFGILMLCVASSRGGHTTLLNGYFTPILVLGVLMALTYAKDHYWLSAIGVFLAAGKPTYALPLGIVMLARGNYKSLSLGVALSILGGLASAGYLAMHDSWSGLIESVREGQQMHMADPREFPVNTWTRVDITAILAKWMNADPSELKQLIYMLPLMVVPCWALDQRRRSGDSNGSTTISGSIAILAILLTLYHHVYDTLILLGPLAGLLGAWSAWKSKDTSTELIKLTSRVVGIACILLLLPWWNYFSSEIVLLRMPIESWLPKILTSLNCLGLLTVLIILIFRIDPKQTTA